MAHGWHIPCGVITGKWLLYCLKYFENFACYYLYSNTFKDFLKGAEAEWLRCLPLKPGIKGLNPTGVTVIFPHMPYHYGTWVLIKFQKTNSRIVQILKLQAFFTITPGINNLIMFYFLLNKLYIHTMYLNFLYQIMLNLNMI
jgi:hypothetical protein